MRPGEVVAGELSSMSVAPSTLRHVALVPDGNRRWARARGLPIEAGHRRGFLEVAPLLLEALWEHGVQVTTLWMLSADNFNRSADELRDLMVIYRQFVTLMLPRARRHGVEVRHMGRADRLAPELVEGLHALEGETRGSGAHVLQLGLDCGGKEEIVRIVAAVVRRCLEANESSATSIERCLTECQSSVCDPDLIVRTGGEQRLSGLLPLQSVHSEMYFIDIGFPDMTVELLERALASYLSRERRYGR